KDTYTNDNTVAIKMLKDEIACDKTMLKRFKNEFRVENDIRHTNIVNMYDFCTNGEKKYMVMEYVSGITLKRYLKAKGGPLSFEEIMSYTIQTLKALKAAHDGGVIHRDVKPQNIMVLRNGLIKVMDFGIAKLPNAETVTMTDKAIGTVYYMSPEQASAKPIDCRSDLYSLGAMIYELATGKLPFDGESPVSIAVMQINNDPTPPREINPDIPVGLEQIILCAMSKKPSERFQSADSMLDYVKRLQKNKKIKFDKLPCRGKMSNFMSFIRRIFGVKRK
ncbi:MAG: serine/threonine protein kinase, partial [Clostridia bacterium]|nr:serine/threonine protein kinase [Clostridia bacterium]